MLPFKAVLFSYPRSGGHMLQQAMNTHPQLFVSNEFAVDTVLPKTLVGANYNLVVNWLFKDAEDKYKILYVPTMTGSVGDMMTDDNDWWKLIREIINTPSIKILSLRRGNCLSRYVSHCLAEKNNSWVDGSITTDTLRVEPLKLFEDTTRIDQMYRDRLGLLREHKIWNLIYEDILANWDESFASIFRFLNVQVRSVAPQTIRQERRPIHKVVTNYGELKTIFKDSPYLLY